MKCLTLQGRKNLWFSFLAFGLSLCFLSCSQNAQQEKKDSIPVVERVVSNLDLHKPTHIIKFKKFYISSELHENRLAIFDTLELKNIRYFDPKSVGKRFSAPHYLAISPNGHLLISNGWGKGIVEIKDIDGTGWKEFNGPRNNEFKAPHGICVDEDGWIYVGDSLHSRLVRFRDMQGSSWQVFKDVDHKIAYSRQLICKDGAIWVSNSYEAREGLNPGQGSNVLKISEFSTGKVQIVYEDKHTNITGILPLKNLLLVARWGYNSDIVAINLKTNEVLPVNGSHNKLGIPYGFFEDKNKNQIITAYFGSFKNNLGGFTVLKR
jgi:NHL repeat